MEADAADPHLGDYRRAAREWLRATFASARSPDRPGPPGGDGDDDGSVDDARRVQRLLSEGGYAGITYPREYGGQGLTLDHERTFLSEASAYGLPPRLLAYSLNILAPAMVAFGNDEQKRGHVPRILTGDELWVQLLSEPSGGSDLAGLITRADRDGDCFVISGQKTWSTGAHYADFGLCVVRTRWDVPKHRGISVFIVDLHAPGVEVRPIRQIDERTEFCEVFLTDVVVPAANLVGGENEGWAVVRGLLAIEHEWVGRSNDGGAPAQGGVEELVALARARGLDRDAGVRRRVAEMHMLLTMQELTAARISDAVAAGRLDKAFGGVLKLNSADILQRRAELGMMLAGSSGIAWRRGDDVDRRWSLAFLGARSSSIAGGTNEIQRNNVGERALGLPREPSDDRERPFNEIGRRNGGES